jgi:hypothetical protein
LPLRLRSPTAARACYAGIGEYSVYEGGITATVARPGGALRPLSRRPSASVMHKLLTRVFPEYAARRALLRRLGFEEIGTHRRHGQLDGVWCDCVSVERLLDPPPTRNDRRDARLPWLCSGPKPFERSGKPSQNVSLLKRSDADHQCPEGVKLRPALLFSLGRLSNL